MRKLMERADERDEGGAYEVAISEVEEAEGRKACRGEGYPREPLQVLAGVHGEELERGKRGGLEEEGDAPCIGNVK